MKSISALLAIIIFIPFQLMAEVPFELPKKDALAKLKMAVVYTEKGAMTFELFPEEAPWHVANLKYLADKQFYKDMPFHFFEDGYILQAGAPTANPDSGPGYELPAEFNSNKNVRGALGMARRPDKINAERSSHGSQFYILISDNKRMDGSYTVFGSLVEGFEVLDRLKKNDRIINLVVFVKGL